MTCRLRTILTVLKDCKRKQRIQDRDPDVTNKDTCCVILYRKNVLIVGLNSKFEAGRVICIWRTWKRLSEDTVGCLEGDEGVSRRASGRTDSHKTLQRRHVGAKGGPVSYSRGPRTCCQKLSWY